MNGPNRYEYDDNKYYYDQETDTVQSRDDSYEVYDGDGNKVDNSD